jgi:hypothetical protein
MPYGGNESVLYVEYSDYGTQINIQSPINDSYIFLGSAGYIWLNATPVNKYNVTVYCGVYLDNVLQYAGTGFNNSVVSFKTGALTDGSHIAKFSCENADGSYSDESVRFQYMDNAQIKHSVVNNFTSGMYDLRDCWNEFSVPDNEERYTVCFGNRTSWDNYYGYSSNCAVNVYGNPECLFFGSNGGGGSGMMWNNRIYSTLNFSSIMPSNAIIVNSSLGFTENCINQEYYGYGYFNETLKGYYAGSSLSNNSWLVSGSGYYVNNQTCGWGLWDGNVATFGKPLCSSPLLLNASLNAHLCNEGSYYDINYTNYSIDVTDLMSYARDRGNIGQLAFTGNEEFVGYDSGWWFDGGRIYSDSFVFDVYYAEPIPPVPSAMSVYASNITELGKGVGGFFYGLQFGVLNIMLGLLFVGVIGLFFYAVFNIVSTSVKEGFKK